MPKKTKEQIEKSTLEKEQKKAGVKEKKATKKVTKKIKEEATVKTKKAATEAKKVTSKSTTKKTTTAKKATSKSTTKKAITAKKATTSKKVASSKKSATKKTTKSSAKKVAKNVAIPIVEYYDLPYRYNQTIVKLLAQTPTTLFVYWDISDDDRENFKKIYGENFFEETRPILIIHNTTLNYSFEVEINDFANSWYLHVTDSKCNYTIELGRRPIVYNENINTDYIYISSSNYIESPNNKILFNNIEHKVYFRNVKTNITSTKSISFIKNMGKIYNIYDLYEAIYKDEVKNNTLGNLESSMFK